jgi:hypothetical protein
LTQVSEMIKIQIYSFDLCFFKRSVAIYKGKTIDTKINVVG